MVVANLYITHRPARWGFEAIAWLQYLSVYSIEFILFFMEIAALPNNHCLPIKLLGLPKK